MSKEIEVKFLQIDVPAIRTKLKKVGAVLEDPMKLMRRVMIKTDKMIVDNSFLRVRDEGNRVTMTYKKFGSQTIDGCEEIEVIIDDFEEAIALLRALELTPVTYQESKREIWSLDGAEVMIDEWPWIKPYIEIEGEDEELVRIAAQKLGFDWQNATFGSVMHAYEAEYPVLLKTGAQISDVAEAKFGDKIPSILLS